MNTILEFLAGHWAEIVAVTVLAALAVIAGIKFFRLSAAEQKERIKEWLLYAVTSAETELGGGTGKLKLATVYDMFVRSFPVLKNFITVERFSSLVDEALEDMRAMLANNRKINDIVSGEGVGSET